ncbi:uncharacterized protein LOC111278413 [Durio zibethinus]|uniref:Uncharacterized protein LOC111278413 n=1 Tax=Durio zibethinus TaxID=66656 RepID=A0A6P5WZ38_DURZI|nr:uncharacterized protein LOC111278413 [Durio zibethinus]
MEDYSRSHERQLVVKAKRTSKWQAPNGETVKINFDGALDKEKKFAGIGVIGRNSKGKVLGTLCNTVTGIKDPEIIEGMAAVRAAEYACMMGFQKIILEGDALGIVAQIAYDQGRNQSAVGNRVMDTRLELNHLVEWPCSHTRRETNGAAYRLARIVVDRLESLTWNGGYLEDIKDIVIHEMLLLI